MLYQLCVPDARCLGYALLHRQLSTIYWIQFSAWESLNTIGMIGADALRASFRLKVRPDTDLADSILARIRTTMSNAIKPTAAILYKKTDQLLRYDEIPWIDMQPVYAAMQEGFELAVQTSASVLRPDGLWNLPSYLAFIPKAIKLLIGLF